MLTAAVIVFLVEIGQPLPIGGGSSDTGSATASEALRHAAPAFEQHFSPAEDLERLDVEMIEQASEAVDLAAYVLTDASVIEALDDAATRGVKVRIFRDSDEGQRGGVGAALAQLERDGAAIEFKEPTRPLMHLKTFCVDGHTLRTGSANFSPSGLKRQDNDLEIIRGPGVCAKFEVAFERMWSR